ncbi:MAG: hypothetical protein LBS20_20360 [Prevotella sp.]|nr:hypothetical protein [Prevotella sp.]
MLREEYAQVTNQEQEDAFKAKVRDMVNAQTPDEMMASLAAIDKRITELILMCRCANIFS